VRLQRTWLAVSAFMLATGLAQAQPAAAFSSAEQPLKKFLQNYVKDPHSDGDKTCRYLDAFVDLNGDGKQEAIVFLTGDSWCGTGGCRTLVLARKGASWKVVTHITITRPPIRVLSSTSHGWHDISVWVQGGGIQPGYEAELRFDGKNYPGNPSVPPGSPINRKSGGASCHTLDGGPGDASISVGHRQLSRDGFFRVVGTAN